MDINQKQVFKNTKKLFAANIIMLTVVVLAFILIIHFFSRIREFMEKDVRSKVETIVTNSDLSRSLTSLEIDITSLLTTIIRQPNELSPMSRKVITAFDNLHRKIGKNYAAINAGKDQFYIDEYGRALNSLINTLEDIKGNVMELSELGEVFSTHLNDMEDSTGRLMVDYALGGKSITGLQQAYALIPFCKERISKAHILIEASVLQSNPFILGASVQGENGNQETVTDTLSQLTQTLKTLTSADEEISGNARALLSDVPRYMDILGKLDIHLKSYNSKLTIFNDSWSSVISSLAEADSQVSAAINVINIDMHNLLSKASMIIYLISAIVFGVSFTGWIFIRRIGWQLQSTANEALVAKTELQQSHDILELRVEERTADLENANEQLLQEIAERRQLENRIRASLEEKEVLLQEIHHRVKNNMTIIHSLLYMQANKVNDERYRELLNESINRIKTMALTHEKLYHSKDLTKIDFNDYLTDIANNIASSYVINPDNISIAIDVQNVAMGVDDAIPSGLIVNELFSNALKHAFPNNREGKITLSLQTNDQNEVELKVNDNGIGMPEDLDSRKSASLGLNLVDALVRQLQGSITLDTKQGTCFIITFQKDM